MVVLHTTPRERSCSSFTKIEFADAPPPASSSLHHQKQQEVATKKKNVRFAHHDRVRPIPHINDLSDEEIDAVWMHPDDFRDIRKECQAIILVLEHDPNLLLLGKNAADVELRGLEHHMLQQRKQAQAYQDLLYDTVEEIQRTGESSSMDVSDIMASLCQRISSRQVAHARKTALQDEKEANIS